MNIFCQVARSQRCPWGHHASQHLLSNGAQAAKLCNFGLSRFKSNLKATKVEDGFQGTDMYLAPEMLIKWLKCTKASDMWAFGATLIEVFADEDFWEVEANTPSFVVAIVRQMRKKVKATGLESSLRQG